MVNSLPSILILMMWSIPVMASAFLPVYLADARLGIRLLLVGLIPTVFVLTFILVSGLLSKFGQAGIKKGKFPRLPFDPVYFKRRIYGTCWTTIYYFKPLYSVALAIPFLKTLLFRLFGYKGSTKFIVYPDTWIRDLPLLNIGEGAYLSNRATIGTNLCLSDGTIYVDGIKIGEKALVGHLAVIGAGAKIEEQAEIGVGATLGIKSRIAKHAKIGINATVMHGAVIGENVHTGNSSYIGMRAHIYPNIELPAASVIPAGAMIRTQADLEPYFSSERELINNHLSDVASRLGDLASGT